MQFFFIDLFLWSLLINARLYDQVEFRILSVFDLILYIGSWIQISDFSICRFLTDLVLRTHVDFGFQFSYFIFGLRIWCSGIFIFWFWHFSFEISFWMFFSQLRKLSSTKSRLVTISFNYFYTHPFHPAKMKTK